MEIIDIDNDYMKPWKAIFSNNKSTLCVAKHHSTGIEHFIKTIQISNIDDVDDHFTEVLIHAQISKINLIYSINKLRTRL